MSDAHVHDNSLSLCMSTFLYLFLKANDGSLHKEMQLQQGHLERYD